MNYRPLSKATHSIIVSLIKEEINRMPDGRLKEYLYDIKEGIEGKTLWVGELDE